MPWVAIHARSGLPVPDPRVPLLALRRAFRDRLTAEDLDIEGDWLCRSFAARAAEPDPEDDPRTRPATAATMVTVYYEIRARPEAQGDGWEIRKSYWNADETVQYIHVHRKQGLHMATDAFFCVWPP